MRRSLPLKKSIMHGLINQAYNERIEIIMANYGAKSPLFAPFVGAEPSKAPPEYGTGITIGKLVSCGVTPNSSEGRLDADNMLAEYVKEITDEDIALETDDLLIDKAVMIYGAEMRNGDLVYTQGDTPPLGGYAFYHTAKRNGVTYHIGHFFPKVRAARGAKTFSTKGQNITFGTSSISMKAMFTNTGDIEMESDAFTSEDAAFAWCAGKVGLGEYYTVNVQVQGDGASQGVDHEGKVFLSSGSDFSLIITGTPTALYDNGVNNVATISGGAYTVANLDSDHDIAVIF